MKRMNKVWFGGIYNGDQWASMGQIFRCLCPKEEVLISSISRLNTRFEVYFPALVSLLNLIIRACHELEQPVI